MQPSEPILKMRRQRAARSSWRIAEEGQFCDENDSMEPTMRTIRNRIEHQKRENLKLNRKRDQLKDQMTMKYKEYYSQPGTSKEGIKKLSTNPTKLTDLMLMLDMMKQRIKLRNENPKVNPTPCLNATNFGTGISSTTYPHQHDCNSEKDSSSDDLDAVNMISNMKINDHEEQNQP